MAGVVGFPPLAGEMSEGQRGPLPPKQPRPTPNASHPPPSPHKSPPTHHPNSQKPHYSKTAKPGTPPRTTSHSDQLAEICRQHHVKRLEVFGSAAVGDFNAETGDIDFLVEIQLLPPGKHADAYFGLLNDLQSIFGRSIDLVEEKAIENPHFRASIDETRQPVYGH